MSSDLILVIVVATALVFDFTNGFHDTANAIATSVSTRAMSPRSAVLLSAVLNFAGAFISLKVAATVGQGIVDQPGRELLADVRPAAAHQDQMPVCRQPRRRRACDRR